MLKGEKGKYAIKIRGTMIEREVGIYATNLTNKPSPLTPLHKTKWRICENI
jgi:hypothetical protein